MQWPGGIEHFVADRESILLAQCIDETDGVIPQAGQVAAALARHPEFMTFAHQLARLPRIQGHNLDRSLSNTLLLEAQIRTDVEKNLKFSVHAPDINLALKFLRRLQRDLPQG